jgi:hypothetical protein
MHHEFIPEGTMVNKERYNEVLTHLQETAWSITKCGQPKTRFSCVALLCHVNCHLCSSSSPSIICDASFAHVLSGFHTMLILLLLSMVEGLAEGLSLQGCSGSSNGFKVCFTGNCACWHPNVTDNVRILTELCSCWWTVVWRQLCLWDSKVPRDLRYGSPVIELFDAATYVWH